jgi:hypothetical protein
MHGHRAVLTPQPRRGAIEATGMELSRSEELKPSDTAPAGGGLSNLDLVYDGEP